MKRILIATNVLLLGIIFFMACKNGNTMMQVGATPIANNCAVPCKDYSAVALPGTVDGEFVKQMSEAYAVDKGKAFITGVQTTSGSAAKDALSISFSIDQVKNLIWKMEHEACMAGCNPKTLKLGVRLYYIKYSLRDTANVPPDLSLILKKNANKHAIVMVPAIWRNGQYYDFDLNSGSKDCFSQPITTTPSHKVLGGIIPEEGDNHGGLGPPPDPGTYPTNQ